MTSGSPPNVFIQNVWPRTTWTGDPEGFVKSVPSAGVTPRPVKKLSLTGANQNCDGRPPVENPPMRGMMPTTALKESARACKSFIASIENAY